MNLLPAKIDVNNQIKFTKRKRMTVYSNPLFMGFIIIMPICAVMTVYCMFPVLISFTSHLFNPIESNHYPTSIPWIDNPSECEHTGRKWHDKKCWDEDHSPMF